MKKKVFVIDDEKDIQDIIRINLRDENYRSCSLLVGRGGPAGPEDGAARTSSFSTS